MEIQERIKEAVQNHNVLLFMKGTPDFPQCGFSSKTVQALQACGAEFSAVDVLADDDVRQGIKDFSQWPTVPQLYINGEFIGGCDIVMDMYENGSLKEKLQEETSQDGTSQDGTS